MARQGGARTGLKGKPEIATKRNNDRPGVESPGVNRRHKRSGSSSQRKKVETKGKGSSGPRQKKVSETGSGSRRSGQKYETVDGSI